MYLKVSWKYFLIIVDCEIQEIWLACSILKITKSNKVEKYQKKSHATTKEQQVRTNLFSIDLSAGMQLMIAWINISN
jgi:hypothetical protein